MALPDQGAPSIVTENDSVEDADAQGRGAVAHVGEARSVVCREDRGADEAPRDGEATTTNPQGLGQRERRPRVEVATAPKRDGPSETQPDVHRDDPPALVLTEPLGQRGDEGARAVEPSRSARRRPPSPPAELEGCEQPRPMWRIQERSLARRGRQLERRSDRRHLVVLNPRAAHQADEFSIGHGGRAKDPQVDEPTR